MHLTYHYFLKANISRYFTIGKTMFAEAIAGSLDYNLITVTMANISDKMVGESLHKLRGVFLASIQKAPCVLFFGNTIELQGMKLDEST